MHGINMDKYIYSTLLALKTNMVLGKGVWNMGSGWYWLRLVTTGGDLYLY
jgi:hypothetical protein